MKRAELTVFFSLIFILTLTFICSIAESARMQGVRMRLQIAADAACESAFAAYDRTLLDKFKVFFYDGSNGGKSLNNDSVVNSIKRDMEEIICPNELYDEYLDFYKIKLNSSNIDSIALATDDKGMVFREQAIMSMEGRYGIAYAKDLLEESNILKKNIDDGDDYKKKEKENEDTLISLQEQKKQIDEENVDAAKEASKTENPAAVMAVQKSMGIFQSVIPNGFELSQNQLVLEELPVKRTLCKGNGLKEYSTDMLSNVLFEEYLMQMFGNAVNNSAGDNQIKNQMEYLLAGKAHDVDNLKAVIERLLLVREGANFVYILTDAEKVLEAETLAITLVGYTALPPLIEATKYAILLSWSLAESMLDVKRLLAGKKVAIVKGVHNWQLGLANIGNLVSETLRDDADGITYEHYLRLLLIIQNQETTASRCLDLVEMKVRSEENKQRFRLDNMICQLGIDVTAETESLFYSLFSMKKKMKNYGIYQIKRDYSYSTWS